MPISVETYLGELGRELKNILSYWQTYMPDEKHGGFYGQVDGQNRPVEEAAKGVILNARILWTFSAACSRSFSEEKKAMADQAYQYLETYFRDKRYGGLYWELDYLGKPVNPRKQIYAQAFAVYALSEYYRLTSEPAVLDWILELFDLLEEKAADGENGGYIEAFGEDWSELDDLRLSEKDANEKKGMNTHIHMLEAYTNLCRIHRTREVETALQQIIRLMQKHFVGPDHHLRLFFDEKWNVKSSVISYGHDIETSWLIYEAAEVLGDEALIDELKPMLLGMVDTFLAEGVDSANGVMNELDKENGHLDTDRHWWPQAEAMVGLVYAYRMSGDDRYLGKTLKIWMFIKEFIIDHRQGEWFWKVDRYGNPDLADEKAGFWKCPYHNSRACMEIARQLG